jgi:hypothetical protein
MIWVNVTFCPPEKNRCQSGPWRLWGRNRSWQCVQRGNTVWVSLPQWGHATYNAAPHSPHFVLPGGFKCSQSAQSTPVEDPRLGPSPFSMLLSISMKRYSCHAFSLSRTGEFCGRMIIVGASRASK